MKAKIFLLCLITSVTVVSVHTGLSVLIWQYAEGNPDGSVAGLIVWTYVLDLLLAVCCGAIGIGYIFRPLREINKRAAMGVHAETDYPELKPIVDIVNSRSEENDKQYEELLEDKKFMDRAKKSKDEFIANITHEMNTPLTSIIGYAELLKAGGMTDAQREKALDTIIKQSGRLHGLISCVINYNEIDNDSLPPYEVDLSGMCGELLDAVRPDADKRGITVTAEIEPGIKISSRTERVTQVLGNIIGNAIRYNKEGGSLRVCLNRGGGKIFATVTDTGIGIPNAELGKIFDRFYTVDKSHNGIGGGYGLGLATVKKICKKSGWIIRVVSTAGEGTTFTIEMQ